MLKSLYIKNYALIDELFLEFHKGLNIITGETGAGKSIIVDAFIIALGERASVNLIRNNQKKAIIEAIFEPKSIILDEFSELHSLLSEEEDIIIRREINSNGNSRSFLNDSPVPLNTLKEIGNRLVDFHGQHQHQLLLNSSFHLTALDSTINFNKKLEDYRNEYFLYRNYVKELDNLNNLAKEFNIKNDHYSFELKEIEKINPKENELSELEDKLKIVENSENIFKLTENICSILGESSNSVLYNLDLVIKLLEQLKTFDINFEEFYKECNSVILSLTEINRFTNNYKSNIEFDENLINNLKLRFLDLNGLKKKYSGYDEVFNRINFLNSELNSISNVDKNISDLKEKIALHKSSLLQQAKEISNIRKENAIEFSNNIVEKLKFLGMEHSKFEVLFHETENVELNSNGIDKIDFMISTNKGENLKALKEVASGGEISRIMLAMKYIISEYKSMPMLVFDEIDSGISGKIGQKTGLLMKELSKKHQILAITHLAQIAALGDANYNVLKTINNNDTVTKINLLNKEEKINVIAQMLSGECITESAIENAKQLINE